MILYFSATGNTEYIAKELATRIDDACIGNCPVDAIKYGTITNGKEQYNFGKYKYVIDK